jgi:methylated-DNA-[protein]-cysteine S-methyltransferase
MTDTRLTVHDTMPSPVGELLLTATDAGLTRVYFERHRHMDAIDPAWGPAREYPGGAAEVLAEARAQLAAYFDGRLRAFDLPLAPRGSAFQQAVWAALREIPYGHITSYGALAAKLGDPLATRAVAGANARNPISIVVPCHRVIGVHGALTGFGGGIERKRWLLAHEGVVDAGLF